LAHSHGRYGHGVPRVPTDKPTGKPIIAPLVATTFYRDNEHNNQIEIDNLGDKQVSDNTRRGGDGRCKASGAMDNTTRGGGGGWGAMQDKRGADNVRQVTRGNPAVDDTRRGWG
jgi:hypothetical protein